MTFYFGVDYYPEHWPASRWPEDARLMQEAGINLVRLAEFAWSRLQPAEDQFDFTWLDQAIDLLADHEIRIVLGTPTASAPPWLMAQDPTLFRTDDKGQRIPYGHRRQYCPNHPLYHQHTRRIVEALAEHYQSHPAVIAWQIDNEFGDRCYCDVCRTAFQTWLKKRYETLDELNQRWGTVFWSHTYTSWDQVPVPLATVAPHNPGLALDYYRFCSDSYVRYQRLQVELLRQLCPRHFITHNVMGFGYPNIDYFELARDLDMISWDAYWRHQWNMTDPAQPSNMALSHDTIRGLKQRNFWVMEQQSGPGGWEFVSAPPRPGQLRLWAYHAVAHGADGIIFFRWRTARFGAEEYWHGILDHHGEPGRRYSEVALMGQEIKAIGDNIAGSTLQPSVAMVLSYDSRFAFQIQANNPDFRYPDHFHDIYRSFHRRHVPVDIVAPDADLSAYALVVAPALHVLPEDVAAKLQDYVAGGGVLVLTPRTGVKDETNTVIETKLPGSLATLCGIVVEEYISLPPGTQNCIAFTGTDAVQPQSIPASVWCDVLAPQGAEVIARYTEDFYAGEPAITRNRYGGGLTIYVGAMGAEIYETLADQLLAWAKVQPLPSVPDGVEISERVGEEKRYLFLLNHTDQAQSVSLDGSYHNLVEQRAARGDVKIEPYGVQVLSEELRSALRVSVTPSPEGHAPPRERAR